MTKTTKLIWRLKEIPTSENLREFVKDGILSKDEAREILFTNEEISDRDTESLKSEIKFLRELVEKLSQGRNQIVDTIRIIEKPYKIYPWYGYYTTWSNDSGKFYTGTDLVDNGSFTSSSSFSSIRTF
jgi:hypothetical protein